MFLAPKIKYCLTINEFGVIEEHKTYKGFGDVNRLLDSKKYFEMQEGKSVSSKFPLSWKKSFSDGVIIPTREDIVTNVVMIIFVKIVKAKRNNTKNLKLI